MALEKKTNITVQNTVQAPIDKVWKNWTTPENIVKWNAASDDWHTTKAENDLRTGGKFVWRMEAKNGSMGFDFSGVYDDVKNHSQIASTLDDGRKWKITFTDKGDKTEVVETFEAETENPIEMQRDGWQAILNNFKKHVEVGL
ncbi:SRPBCC family protein [Flavobacterium sp. W1B]|uniref:SRPBCC family protein n=1 Tax=Flavobacterium sp. W1B TaxID=3394146 RepID=UPI0039BC3A66